MLRKHPPVGPVLSCLSCFQKPSVGACQVVSNSPDPGIAWPSVRFPPDLWWWFEEDTASIRRLIHSGYMAKQREATTEESGGCWVAWRTSSLLTKSDHLKPRILRRHHWSSGQCLQWKKLICYINKHFMFCLLPYSLMFSDYKSNQSSRFLPLISCHLECNYPSEILCPSVHLSIP